MFLTPPSMADPSQLCYLGSSEMPIGSQFLAKVWRAVWPRLDSGLSHFTWVQIPVLSLHSCSILGELLYVSVLSFLICNVDSAIQPPSWGNLCKTHVTWEAICRRSVVVLLWWEAVRTAFLALKSLGSLSGPPFCNRAWYLSICMPVVGIRKSQSPQCPGWLDNKW